MKAKYEVNSGEFLFPTEQDIQKIQKYAKRILEDIEDDDIGPALMWAQVLGQYVETIDREDGIMKSWREYAEKHTSDEDVQALEMIMNQPTKLPPFDPKAPVHWVRGRTVKPKTDLVKESNLDALRGHYMGKGMLRMDTRTPRVVESVYLDHEPGKYIKLSFHIASRRRWKSSDLGYRQAIGKVELMKNGPHSSFQNIKMEKATFCVYRKDMIERDGRYYYLATLEASSMIMDGAKYGVIPERERIVHYLPDVGGYTVCGINSKVSRISGGKRVTNAQPDHYNPKEAHILANDWSEVTCERCLKKKI